MPIYTDYKSGSFSPLQVQHFQKLTQNNEKKALHKPIVPDGTTAIAQSHVLSNRQ